MNFSFNVHESREQFRWGPLDGVLLTMQFPVIGLLKNITATYGKQLWPDGALLSKRGRFLWLQDDADLRRASLECFQQYMLNDNARSVIRANYDAQVEKLRVFAEAAYQTDFSDLSDDILLKQFTEWAAGFTQFWATAGLPELSTWGAADWIAQQLKTHGFSEADQARALEVLTAPEDSSFFQKAEAALIRTVLDGGDLNAYLRQWYWIHNSYAGARRCTRQDIDAEVEQLRAKGSLQEQLHNIEENVAVLRAKKIAIQKEFGLPDAIMRASRSLGICIAWQDERKGEQWRQVDVLFAFLRRIEERFGVPLGQSTWMLADEVIASCNGNPVLPHDIAQRKYACVLGMSMAELSVLVGEEAKPYIDTFWDLQTTSQELRGIVVSKRAGEDSAMGIARRIDSPSQANDFVAGEILVTAMTTPDFMPIIRKAAAIVTDQGGLTAHAAVVSRELGIPCIVGTRTATQQISTGDRIALNLTTGTITLLDEA